MRSLIWVAASLVAVCAFLAVSPLVNDDLVPQASIDRTRRVLVVLAHADDEVMSAGLLSRFAKQGAVVHLVTLTDGAANPMSKLDACEEDDIRDCRARELRQSARRIGIAEVSMAMLPDGKLAKHVDEGVAFAVEAFGRLAPDTVLTVEQSGLNGNEDHRAAHVIAARALAQVAASKPLPEGFRMFLSTLPFPINVFLRTRMPEGVGVAMRHVLLDEEQIKLKEDVASTHSSQSGTFNGLSLGFGPGPVFRWAGRESFYVLEGNTLGRFLEGAK